jgi:hypothetical protein
MASVAYSTPPSSPTERTFHARRTPSIMDGGIRKRRRMDTPFPSVPPKSRRRSLDTPAKYDGECEEDVRNSTNNTKMPSTVSFALPIRSSTSLSESPSSSPLSSPSPSLDPVYHLEQSLPNLRITTPASSSWPSPRQDSPTMAYQWRQSAATCRTTSDEEKIYIRLRIPSGMRERMKRTNS